MVVSIEERQAISRRNGAKSRGPVTDAGKFICSANSIKHGYYAKVHSLPDECPDETARLRERWFADKAPRSVDEEFLVTECFQANLMASRVHRARCAQITAEQNAATKSWHAERDEDVSKLWKELLETRDAREILPELRATTLGLRALSGEWSRLKGLLQEPGYWGSGALKIAAVMSGCRFHNQMLFEDEDAYRLFLWNLRCEPEPRWEIIERMLEPAHRPPGLRDADRDVLMPSPEDCRARLIQWADDVLQELAEDYERVWTELEAPQLARRTNPKAIVTDVFKEQQIHRASSEYRAMYYKAHNALEAIRKRRAAEEKEARKNADRVDSRRSDENQGPADYAGHAAPEPEVGPQDELSPGVETPVLTNAPVPAEEAVAGPRNEPSRGAETPVVAEAPVPLQEAEAGPRNEPSPGADSPVVAEAPVPLQEAEIGPRNKPSLGVDSVVSRSPDLDTPATGSLLTGSGRPPTSDVWRPPPAVVTQAPDGAVPHAARPPNAPRTGLEPHQAAHDPGCGNLAIDPNLADLGTISRTVTVSKA